MLVSAWAEQLLRRGVVFRAVEVCLVKRPQQLEAWWMCIITISRDADTTHEDSYTGV